MYLRSAKNKKIIQIARSIPLTVGTILTLKIFLISKKTKKPIEDTANKIRKILTNILSRNDC